MSLHHRTHDAYGVRSAGWGEAAPHALAGDDSDPRPYERESAFYEQVDGMWSACTGVVGGALGGVALVGTAEAISRWKHLGIDFIGLAGSAARQFPGFAGTHMGGALFAAFAGAMFGGGIAWLARRATRILPRLLFFSISMPALWVLVQAFLIQQLSPWMRTVPAFPLLAGALVYGLFLTFSLPIVRKRVRPLEGPAYR